MSCCATLLHPTIAHAQRSEWGGPCSDYTSYLITPQGRCIDLRYLTPGRLELSDATRNSREQWPEWLVGTDIAERNQHQKVMFKPRHEVDAVGITWDDRWVEITVDFPYVRDRNNNYEMRIIDCFTGDKYTRNFQMGGKFSESYSEADNLSETSLSLRRKDCEVGNVSPFF